jgi:hypothetical protein
MTLLELIYLVEDLEKKANNDSSLLEKQIRFASQPDYPFEYSVKSEIFETDEAFYLAEDQALRNMSNKTRSILQWFKG